MRNVVWGTLLIGLFAAACAGTSATPLTVSAREPGTVFFVENHGKDQRHLEQIIATVIRARGLDVTAGGPNQRPAAAAFVVTYQDHWAWDMRTFLREIKIEVRDAKTSAIVAVSRTYQDSLAAMGKSYEGIVRNATNQLFDGAP
ncbi:MAG: hypothetical protein VCE43_18010 [Myxococcota bacterium]